MDAQSLARWEGDDLDTIMRELYDRSDIDGSHIVVVNAGKVSITMRHHACWC